VQFLPGCIPPANRLKKYGLTREMWMWVYIFQDGRCAICKREADETLSVDHDHVSSLTRGLLCNGCNTGPAILGDKLDGWNLLLNYPKETLVNLMRYFANPPIQVLFPHTCVSLEQRTSDMKGINFQKYSEVETQRKARIELNGWTQITRTSQVGL
jgi:recombination endonuclease VII